MLDPMADVGGGTESRGYGRFSPLELRVQVCREHGVPGAAPRGRVLGLRLHSDPLTGHGRVWHWLVDVDPGLPALADVLAGCRDFLVDDDCGRAVGVVEDIAVEPDTAAPARLLVVQGWGRQHISVPIEDVVEVAPWTRRLVITCRAGHRRPDVEPARAGRGPSRAVMRIVRSLLAWLGGRRSERV